MTRLAILTASIAMLVACSESQEAVQAQDTGQFGELSATVSFSGTGYTPHDGQAYEVALVDARGVVDSLSRTHGGDLLEFEFTNVVPEVYEIHLYFDVDASGGCDANDHMWSFDIGTVEGDTTVEEDHTTNFTDVCGTF